MSSPVHLASFCRLCLSKTKDRVPLFADENNLGNLMHLIEITIDPDDEPDAVVCYDCVVTLEGFHQFKEQCHVNDEFVRAVPVKLDDSAADPEGGYDDEDDREAGFQEEEEFEEEDRLELSEAEEVFHEIPRQSPKKKKKKKTVDRKKTKSPKNSPPETPVKKRTARIVTKEKPEEKPAKPTIDDLQVLAESYPDFFYFEKGARSIYYTIVYYGERYNSALFNERWTYWQCIHRKRHHCTAQLKVTNDYKTFERRFEHTHGKLTEKEGQAFTPHEALPELFQICKRLVMQKRGLFVMQEVKEKVEQKPRTFEDTFQKFAAGTSKNMDDEDELSASSASDSDEETEDAADSRPKRKIKPNARYESNKPFKKRSIEPEPKRKKEAERAAGKSKPEVEDTDESDDLEEYIAEEDLDLDRIEAECKALNIPFKPHSGPTLDELLVLADSYPDYFFFEKGPRSIYYTLVYYGERYHSALFTDHYTYWQCRHRRKYKCPAQVAVSNNYKMFERRYEHSHPDLPDKEGLAFTPHEALPEIFEACRKLVLKKRAGRRKKLLLKYKFMQAAKKNNALKRGFTEVQGVEEVLYEESVEEDVMHKSIEYVDELVELAED